MWSWLKDKVMTLDERLVISARYVDFVWDRVYVAESCVTLDIFIGFLKFKYRDYVANSGGIFSISGA